MIVTVGKSAAAGSVKAPPSKSMAHRYLICGALSSGSEIKGVDFSEDIKATLGCLEALGAHIKTGNDSVYIGGAASVEKAVKENLFCGESGSTLRFMIPLCLLEDKKFTLSGTERLFSRSLSVYDDICRSQGIEFKQDKKSVTLKGKLACGGYAVRGDISSQFISGLMFALPLLAGDSTVDITGALESASYLGMTVKALADFGVRVKRADEHTFYIKGSQSYKPRVLTVEGDYSNAAFFSALNLTGGNVSVRGLSKKTSQGDAVYPELFEKIAKGTPDIDISDCPDLGPVLMAAAAVKNGAHFTGTHRLKIKESDRGAAMAEELLKFGCRTDVGENEITVHKCGLKAPELPLYGHNDHRIVMSLAVLCTLTGGSIYGAEAVSKSLPDFFDRLSSLGVDIKVENK